MYTHITELHSQTFGYEVSIYQAIDMYIHDEAFVELISSLIEKTQEKYKLGNKYPTFKQLSNMAHKVDLKLDVFYNADVHASIVEYLKKSANRYTVSIERYDARNGAAYYMNAKSCWLNPTMVQHKPAQAFLNDADSYAVIIREDNRNIARFWASQLDEETFVLFNYYGYYGVKQAFKTAFGLCSIDVKSSYVYLNGDGMSNYPYSVCVDAHIEYDESDVIVGTTYDGVLYTDYDVEDGVVIYSEIYEDYISSYNAVMIIRKTRWGQEEDFILSEDAVKLYDGNYGYRYDCIELHNGAWALENDDNIVRLHDDEYALIDECVEYADNWYLADTLADYELFTDSYGDVHHYDDDNVTWLNGCPITQSDANKILGQLSLWG